MEKQERRQKQNVQENESVNPYLEALYSDIEKNLEQLNLPKETQMQATAVLLEIAQKRLKIEPDQAKAYFQLQGFVREYTNINDTTLEEKNRVKQKLFSFIDTMNRTKFEQSFNTEKEDTPEIRDSEIREVEVGEPIVWEQIEQDKIKRWQNGTTKLPKTYVEGEYIAFARVPQLQKPDEPLYFYMKDKNPPELPTGVVNAEVELFQITKPKLGEALTLENVGTTSLYESSEKIKKIISQSFPELEFNSTFGQEVPADYWKNTTVSRESSVDGSIEEGQIFLYDYLPIKGADSDFFTAKILGINNEGNVVVEITDGSNKKFAIERRTWEKIKKLKTDVNRRDQDWKDSAERNDMARPIIQYAKDETELSRFIDIANHQRNRRQQLAERFDADPETKRFNEELFYNTLEREIGELKKGNIQPENLVSFVLEKTTFPIETLRNDAKATLDLRFNMLKQSHNTVKNSYGPTSKEQDQEETNKILDFVKEIRKDSLESQETPLPEKLAA